MLQATILDTELHFRGKTKILHGIILNLSCKIIAISSSSHNIRLFYISFIWFMHIYFPPDILAVVTAWQMHVIPARRWHLLASINPGYTPFRTSIRGKSTFFLDSSWKLTAQVLWTVPCWWKWGTPGWFKPLKLMIMTYKHLPPVATRAVHPSLHLICYENLIASPKKVVSSACRSPRLTQHQKQIGRCGQGGTLLRDHVFCCYNRHLYQFLWTSACILEDGRWKEAAGDSICTLSRTTVGVSSDKDHPA